MTISWVWLVWNPAGTSTETVLGYINLGVFSISFQISVIPTEQLLAWENPLKAQLLSGMLAGMPMGTQQGPN